MAGPAHLTQLSRPGGSSLPPYPHGPPHPRQVPGPQGGTPSLTPCCGVVLSLCRPNARLHAGPGTDGTSQPASDLALAPPSPTWNLEDGGDRQGCDGGWSQEEPTVPQESQRPWVPATLSLTLDLSIPESQLELNRRHFLLGSTGVPEAPGPVQGQRGVGLGRVGSQGSSGPQAKPWRPR